MENSGVILPSLVFSLMILGCMFHLIDEKNVDEK
jgi:hypothetical protein